jgi:hypothetical protein
MTSRDSSSSDDEEKKKDTKHNIPEDIEVAEPLLNKGQHDDNLLDP